MPIKMVIAKLLALFYGAIGAMVLWMGLTIIPDFFKDPDIYGGLLAAAFTAIGGLLCFIVYKVIRYYTEGGIEALSALLGITLYLISDKAIVKYTPYRHAAVDTVGYGVSMMLPVILGYITYRIAFAYFRNKMKAPNNGVQGTLHKVSGPLTPDVRQMDEIIGEHI